MGELYLHDLTNFVDTLGCKTFIETGTGRGTGLLHASRYNFSKLYSIEYVKELFDECKEKFSNDSRIELLHDDSINGLKHILEELSDEPVLFWLDAHFPGADFHFNSYDHLADQPELHKPLKFEIKLISDYRKNCKDVFIIDDLHIYEDGPFQLKNEAFRMKYGEAGIDFIEEAFGETHNFVRDYRHQGFLILTPK